MSRAKWAALLMLPLLLVLAFLVWLRHAPSPSLLARATKVGPVQNWHPRSPFVPDFTPYFWLDDSNILFFRTAPADGYQAIRLELPAKVETPVPALRMEPGLVRFSDWLPALSPDGKWLLWQERTERLNRIVICAVDGSRRMAWPQQARLPVRDVNRALNQPLNEYGWMPDSKQWVRMTHTPTGLQAELYPLNNPKAKTVLPLLPPVGIPLGLFRPQAFFFLPTGRILAIPYNVHFVAPTPEGRELEHREVTRRTHGGMVRVTNLGVGNTAALPGQTATISLPLGAEGGSLVPSPRGDRLAWFMVEKENTFWSEQILRWLPHDMPFGPRYSLSLWVSRSDGRGMRKLGKLKTEPTLQFRLLNMLRWTPDGKRLSFLHDNALWTVPVD